MQARVLATIVPINQTSAASALYASLIPAPLSIPATPQVGIYLEKLDVPHRVDGNPDTNYSNWMEGGLDIRVHNPSTGEDGWYRLSVPVSSQFEFQIGRPAGFPKAMADMNTAPQSDGSWLMSSTFPGSSRNDQTLRFAADPAQTISPELERYVLNQDPIFLLNSPLQGPNAVRYRFIVKPVVPAGDLGAPAAVQVAPVTALAAPQAGTVAFSLDPRPDQLAPDLRQYFATVLGDLSTLINLTQTVPGAMFDSQLQWVFLQSQSDGNGGYQ
jgi:hypothetical protein